MKKTKLFITIALAAMLGCSEQDDYGLSGPQQQEKIRLSAEVDQVYQTRASDTGFADGDQMGVFFVNYDGDTPGTLVVRGNQGDNVCHTYDEANHQWNSSYNVYWKDRKTHIDIYGYYPYLSKLSVEDGKSGSTTQSTLEDVNAWNFEVKTDQSTDATQYELGGYEQSDLLWGKVTNVAPTDQVIHLPMTHRMSTVRVELTEGSGFADGEFSAMQKQVVVKNIRCNAVVDLATGSVSATGDVQKVGIIPYNYNNQYRAIVVPQTIGANKEIFSISLDETPYAFKKNEAFEFVQGKMHNFTIRLDKKHPSGDYTLTLIGESITAWENDDVTHDATMKEYVIINSTPGHLKDAIIEAGKDYRNMRCLKITGEINADDFTFMNEEMDYLSSLNLKEVTIKGIEDQSQSDDRIPSFAFIYKKSLVNIVLPDKLTSIGDHSFMDCVNLTGSLIVPEGVVDIGSNAFRGCSNMTGQLSLPSTLERVDAWAFLAAGFTCELKLPNKLRYIGDAAFQGCKFYGELKLPDGLVDVRNDAFNGLPQMTGSIVIPQSMSVIPTGFVENSGFNGTLVMHDGVTVIGDRAFANAPLKGELYIPKDVEIIGSHAFEGCDFSGTLVLPRQLKVIGDYAFAYNWRLMGTVECPSTLMTIGEGAFNCCRSIEGFVFNAGLETIGSGAFNECFGIGSLVCKGTMPATILGGAFDGVAKDNFTLEVPESAIAQYQVSPGWGDFKRIAAHHELVCRPSVACAINTEAQRRLVLNAEGDWEVVSKPDWCSLSQMSGSKKTELTLTIHQMASGSSMREGEIVFRLTGKGYTHKCTVRQYDYQYGEDEVVQLQSATRGNNGGINIFIVGDGYDAKEISEGNYLKDMQDEIEYFFGIEPYKTYRNYFNVFTGIAVSTESGVGTVNTIRYNRFGTTYTGGVGLKADYGDLFDYAKQAPAINDGNLNQSLVIVIPNSTDYGGICQMWEGGAAIAFCPKSTYGYPLDSRGVIQHEAGGHGFGKLGDEYIYHNAFIDFCSCTCCDHDISGPKSIGWYDNLETTGKMHQVGWSHLIFDPRYSDLVDIYEGGYMHNRGIFRSEQNSCMNNDIPYYSTISRESIVRRIKRYAGEEFSFEDFVANDSREAGAMTRSGINISTPWQSYKVGRYQHLPVIHKGNPVKNRRK